MYETILGKIDALSASLGMIRQNQRTRPGENPWRYSGGADGETLRKGEQAAELQEKVSNGDVESVESTSKMLEKSEVGRTS
jgi:hypothetical protein